ncbi:universal stress protein [Natronomonas sp. F2-12]|jgi:nucleotide-binding universal stress UspA family protein|uniref:Universal stress protein n=1 Tax=Natronomonas aquatica TaxID=2841590 RepID=A0A9R1CPN1_9EURY|nr:universal stress protein [Natronomonas aquatica]MCQ4332693.1 universal stress protein [Natronomonas aquatica]
MRVLIPYDGSEGAEAAVSYADDEHDDDEIVLLYVLDLAEAGYSAPPDAVVPGYWEEWYEKAGESGRELLAEAAEAFDTDVETDVVVGRPPRTILEHAEEHDVDTIVMGSHGRDGLSRILLGSVAETVVRRASVPVTVVR